MSSHEYLSPFHFLVRVQVADQADLLQRMTQRMADLPEVRQAAISQEAIATAMHERERQFPTTLGNGIWFPHARIPGVSRISAVIATVETPLAAATPDNLPIQVVCMLLIPEEQPMEALKFLARLSAYLRLPEFENNLVAAGTPEEAFHILSGVDLNPAESLFASDLMIPCRHAVDAAMPLREATLKMAEWQVDAVPVLQEGKLVGQLTTRQLFTVGVPEFFSQLKSVGFIRFFDPFKEYFHLEADATAASVMSQDYFTCREDATLIEVVFAISVQRYPQAYIVDARNHLLGVINPALLLKRIINL